MATHKEFFEALEWLTEIERLAGEMLAVALDQQAMPDESIRALHDQLIAKLRAGPGSA